MSKFNLEPFIISEQVIKACRDFFDQQGFHEVAAPVLNPSLPLEPNLYSFQTDWDNLSQKKQLFLAASPEVSLKKMLAAGMEQCYALTPSFRNREPADADHNPEFLMLEWYRSEADYQQIMTEVTDLVIFVKARLDQFQQLSPSNQLSYQDKNISLESSWPRLSLAKLFAQTTGVEIKQVLELEQLKQLAEKKGYNPERSTWEALFNQIFVNDIEPALPQGPLFLTDFPAKISPLCQPQPDSPHLAERFEFYLAGIELANGNTERLDAAAVKKAFEQEQYYRTEHDLPTHPIDQDFISALQHLAHTKKKFAGVALGLDRLAMIFADKTSLAEVNSFTLGEV